MRAAIFSGPGKPITIEQLDDPTPAPDQVVVGICRCGICGSDVSMTSPSAIAFPPGIGLGHEFTGEVVAIGRDVTTVKVGDRVACMPAVGCGQCEACRATGNVFYCMSPAHRSVSQGFAEYATVSSKGVIRLPHVLSFADGALVEPMACGLHALRLAQIRGSERVLVLGAGAMAAAVVYWARASGTGSIVVLSRSSHRRALLLGMGANAVHDFGLEAALLNEVLGGPPDVVVECVGKEGMLGKAIDYVRPQGTVISLGMCGHQEPILAGQCSFKELRLLFPLGWTTSEFTETLKEFETGRVHPQVMVSDVIPLDAFPDTMEQLRAGMKSLKIHVDPRLSVSHA